MPTSIAAGSRNSPIAEAIRFQAKWLLPYILRGLFIRQSPRAGVTLSSIDRADLDFIDRLRATHGTELLWISMVTTPTLLLLDEVAVEDVLARSPDPFGPPEVKEIGLGRFQPRAVTVSRVPEFAERRRMNNAALQFGTCPHSSGTQFLRVVDEEVAALDARLDGSGSAPPFDGPQMDEMCARITQRVVLGEADAAVAADLAMMMAESNHIVQRTVEAKLDAFVDKLLHRDPDRPRADRYAAYLAALKTHVAAKRRDSLAAMVADAADADEAADQVTHWLFAMREGLMRHALLTLALLASHPEAGLRVHGEIEALGPSGLLDAHQVTGKLGFTLSCILEAMRLWPAIPLLPRQVDPRLGGPVTLKTSKGSLELEPGTQVLIHNGIRLRDAGRFGADVHRFRPERWLPRSQWTGREPQLAPLPGGATPPPAHFFSGGTQLCAGIDVALLLLPALVAGLLHRYQFSNEIPRLPRGGDLPMSYDELEVRLDWRPAAAEPSTL